MLKSHFQISSLLNAYCAMGHIMPTPQRFDSVPSNRMDVSERKDDVKGKEQHKRPWSIPIIQG